MYDTERFHKGHTTKICRSACVFQSLNIYCTFKILHCKVNKYEKDEGIQRLIALLITLMPNKYDLNTHMQVVKSLYFQKLNLLSLFFHF